MPTSASEIKKILFNLIHDLNSTASLYARFPNKDFTRDRKLPFEKVITLLLGMGGGSLSNELMDYFGCTVDLVTASAFVQQRKKLLPTALETLFHRFVEETDTAALYDGYRLLAVDGSALQIPTDRDDVDSFYPNASGKESYNLLHMNAMYDLLGHTYVDAVVQKGRIRDENRALINMVDRAASNHPAILLADRGYESYNVFAHIQEKGWRYLIRIKDNGVNGGIAHGLDLPTQDEYDFPIQMSFTRSMSNKSKQLATARNRYKILYRHQNFDFLPPKVDASAPVAFYDISFRIVRFKISDDSYETVITNLDQNLFPPQKLKELYAMRWGIETSFRRLKHTIGLLNFHAKKAELVCQEIFARLVMYNFTQLIITFTAIIRNSKKYAYKANFSAAAHICRLFFLGSTVLSSPEILIQKFIIPTRPNRFAPRIQTKKSFSSFSYRMA